VTIANGSAPKSEGVSSLYLGVRPLSTHQDRVVRNLQVVVSYAIILNTMCGSNERERGRAIASNSAFPSRFRAVCVTPDEGREGSAWLPTYYRVSPDCLPAHPRPPTQPKPIQQGPVPADYLQPRR